ncbi:MAG: trehalose-phosphatase [Candidatus Omnitrophota bacterium]
MKPVSAVWEKLKKEIGQKDVFLFLDYDGTLTPLKDTPDQADLSAPVRRALRNLSGAPGVRLAIVSGRSLRNVKRKVGIAGIIYAGNHGLEIDAPGFKFQPPISSGFRAVIRNIRRDLRNKLSGIKGILAEDKGLTLSVHYRLAAKADVTKMRAAFNKAVKPYLVGKKIKISRGKKVLEILPPVEWGKGHAVRWLIRRLGAGQKNALPIYIGDDVTDEAAFRAIRGQGLAIFVGEPRRSSARYYLQDHNEVQDFLEKILGRSYGTTRQGKRGFSF